jgi:hypothetical protein
VTVAAAAAARVRKSSGDRQDVPRQLWSVADHGWSGAKTRRMPRNSDDILDCGAAGYGLDMS